MRVKSLTLHARLKNNVSIMDVTLYATLSCPYCRMEKDWLDQHGIKHKVVLLDINPYEAEKLIKKTGQIGVPVTKIEVQGKEEFIIGFDQQKLTRVLGLN